MKKRITTRLQLNKETLRHLSDADLQGVVGGWTVSCVPSSMTWCEQCHSQSCISGWDCPILTAGQFCC